MAMERGREQRRSLSRTGESGVSEGRAMKRASRDSVSGKHKRRKR